MLDANGSDIASATHIGNLNPFRYRGYYYDTETGLYFLKTRYYDPEIGRFITIDDISYIDPETINGLNLYAYCGNNPVMDIDPTGQIAFLIGLLITVVACTLIGGVAGGISAAANGEDIGKGIGNGLLVGFLFGLSISAIATGVGVCAAGSLGAAVTIGIGVGSAVTLGLDLNNQLQSGGFGSLNTLSMVHSWGIGAVVGGLAGATSYAFGQVAAYYGEMFGLALSGKSVIASVVSKATLMELGKLIGGAAGSYIGGKLINDAATNSRYLDQSIPMWLSTIIKLFGKK